LVVVYAVGYWETMLGKHSFHFVTQTDYNITSTFKISFAVR
jgi:hypothetical protein